MTGKQVGVVYDENAVEEDADIDFTKQFEDSIKPKEPVSVSFERIYSWRAKFTNIFALYDTGSPCNFIRHSEIPAGLCGNKLIETDYHGLGNKKISSYGKIRFTLRIRDRLREIVAFIVPDDDLHMPLLLGRTCLEAFNIKLHLDLENKLKNIFESAKIWLCKRLNEISVTEATAKNKAVSGDKSVQGKLNEQCKLKMLSNKPAEIRGNRTVALINCANESILDKPLAVNTAPIVPVDDKISMESGGIGNVSMLNGLLHVELDPMNVSSEYILNKSLSEENKRAIRQIISDNYEHRDHIPIIEHDYSMKLVVTDESAFYSRPKQCSPEEKAMMLATVKELLAKGTIRPSFSPYASRATFADKKNTIEKRMCIDYRVLNDRTLRDNYPLPLISDCLDYLSDKKWFSTLDRIVFI